MVDKSNLNRIKGMLGTHLGAKIPKHSGGAKFFARKNLQTLFSNDLLNWFFDLDLTLPYKGPIDNFDISQIASDASINNPSAGMSLIKQEEVNKILAKNNKTINTTNTIGLVTTGALNAAGQAVGAKQTATDSNITKGADQAYNMIADGVEKMGPYGKIIGTAMKAAGTAGNIIQELGGGTDQMTTTDKWMDSSFFSWNIGMINGFGGKRTDSFAADQDILALVGSSYGGTTEDINNAAAKAGKKYGMFSNRSRKKANNAIAQAKYDQNLMGDIADTASDQRLAVLSMGELVGLAYSLMTDGGYNLKYTYAAKHGGLLEWNPEINLEWEPQIELNWELPEFKEGGQISEELEWIPEFSSKWKTRTIEQLIEEAKKQNPRFILRMSEPLRYIRINSKDADGRESWGHATHEMNYQGNEVYPMILEIKGKLRLFNDPLEAYKHAKANNNVLKFNSEEEAKLFAESGIDDNGKYYGYKLGWPDFFNASPVGIEEEYSIDRFRDGGKTKEELETPEIEETSQKNLIPEGALHKNKHHMEHAEGLTKKGIPVVDDEGELLAEIEHSEIIFTLEVTKKLEEYYEVFYSEESSNKEKELAALDAGKLLVYQILENTEDRTGLIESCKEGGTLTLKKSTDDLIEEVLEWIPTIIITEEVKEEKPKEDKKKSEKELMKEAIREVLIELLVK